METSADMTADDQAYYERRLAEETERADGAPTVQERVVHRQLALLYRARLAKAKPNSPA